MDQEGFLDPNNCEMWIPNGCLSMGLDVKALHLGELEARVKLQLVPEHCETAGEPLRSRCYDNYVSVHNCRRQYGPMLPVDCRPTLVPHGYVNPKEHFRCTKNLLFLLHELNADKATADVVDWSRNEFTYREYCRFLNKYIMQRKARLFDNR